MAECVLGFASNEAERMQAEVSYLHCKIAERDSAIEDLELKVEELDSQVSNLQDELGERPEAPEERPPREY